MYLAYSESPWYAGALPDATTDRQERDLALPLELGNDTGHVCVDPQYVRGAFKYFTVSLPYPPKRAKIWDDAADHVGQTVFGNDTRYSRPWVRIRSLWVVCNAYPAQAGNGRNYTGYFYSSSSLLNRIWYAGAWTLQLSTIDPRQGSALIDYNRAIDHNHSPVGSWYSNFTIANGSSVTTDGAKRDRVVWPGDMYMAVPGIAVSTYDMVSVRNALDTLYHHQYGDGSLPYAGPPMGFQGEFSDTYHLHTLLGTFNYFLYTEDVDWLRMRWTAYLAALEVSIAKVDTMDLLHVSSVADWLRPGMTGHNLEASAMLHAVLTKSKLLATWLRHVDNNTSSSCSIDTNYSSLIKSWTATQERIETGLARLYCPSTGLFSDNIGARSCHGDAHVDPQDGNSWALISKLNLTQSNLPFVSPKSPHRSHRHLPSGVPSARNISSSLRKRWNRFGAPAVEFPNVISPFASGFELLAHCAAGEIDAAVELALLEWGYLLDGPGFTNSTLAEGFRVDGDMQYPAYWSAARNSHAHGWASGPTAVLMTEVAGIEVSRPGGGSWHVHPRLTRWLGWVRGGFATRYGSSEVKIWRVVEEWIDEENRIGEDKTQSRRMKKGRKGVVVELAVVSLPTAGRVEEVTVNLGGLLRDISDADADANVDIDYYVEKHPATTVFRVTTSGKNRWWVTWDEPETTVSTKMDNNRKGRRRPAVYSIPPSTQKKDEVDQEEEEWFRETVYLPSFGLELRFDDEFVPPEMESREPGVVDWSVMNEYFKTPPPEGWTVDELENKRGREDL
ncbi:Six-hairpin glycosidase-like protein [Apodospora peruviana]|uniref:Six-hairpin glycosidase-like protein n=1 Tax=Apodospora peruviana TaxID=516989 RepID=A0AAE0IIF2_9PEZI|nr:Six-hairpin glycosidase-like protein [Apodospora peruviana]